MTRHQEVVERLREAVKADPTFFERLTENLDSDILDPKAYSEAEIEDMIRNQGGDPDEIVERGMRIIGHLLRSRQGT